ncbi:MAG: amidase, partial [Gemmatimonas sp.]
PVPLDNMEGVSWTFQPYPGGTGALLEHTYSTKGVAAFKRQAFSMGTPAAGAFVIAPWGNAPFPTNDEDIAFLPVHRLAAAIKAGKVTSTKLTQVYLDRLKKYNGQLLFAVTIMEEQGMADAARMDAEIKAGKYRGPLHGIPWGVKDLFAVKGTPTTWGSADFKDRVIDDDAEVVRRIRNAGGVLIAKLTTGQFASGANWFGGMTRNPWNISQGSSDSSAGPGSATAAGCVAFGIGTETSGSIVSPSTTCGLSALRPTFGRVSRYGGMVLSWSQDRVGPMTRTAEDAALVFNVIHGADEKDPGSITMPFHFNRNIDLAGLRIAVRKQQTPEAYFPAFVEKLKALGAKPVDIGEPPTIAGASGGMGVESAAAFDSYVQRKAKELSLDVNMLVAEAKTRADSVARAGGPAAGGGGGRGGAAPDTSGRASVTRWINGRTPTAMEFVQAQRRRQMLITAWQGYLRNTDLYIGAADTGVHAQTGHPVAVVQIGFGMRPTGNGGRGGAPEPAPATPLNPQPLCTQIAGNLYNDDIVLSVAHKYQINTDWLRERPKLG